MTYPSNTSASGVISGPAGIAEHNLHVDRGGQEDKVGAAAAPGRHVRIAEPQSARQAQDVGRPGGPELGRRVGPLQHAGQYLLEDEEGPAGRLQAVLRTRHRNWARQLKRLSHEMDLAFDDMCG